MLGQLNFESGWQWGYWLAALPETPRIVLTDPTSDQFVAVVLLAAILVLSLFR